MFNGWYSSSSQPTARPRSQNPPKPKPRRVSQEERHHQAMSRRINCLRGTPCFTLGHKSAENKARRRRIDGRYLDRLARILSMDPALVKKPAHRRGW